MTIELQTWQLQSNNEDPFILTFDTFDVDDYDYYDDYDGFERCDYDYVYISGGSSSSPQPPKKKHCNHEEDTPGPNPGPFSGTNITLTFKSDSYDTGTGFFAVVTGDVTVTTDVTGESGVGKFIIDMIVKNVSLHHDTFTCTHQHTTSSHHHLQHQHLHLRPGQQTDKDCGRAGDRSE